MTIWYITIKNIKSKPLYSALSVISLALSIALLLGIKQLETSFKNQIDHNLGHIDVVVGAKGSPLQLVLASVLHLDNPTGNISYEDAQQMAKNKSIKSAVPISYGDNYKGFRIVGTTPKFTSIYNAKLDKGKLVEASKEVVLGASVAQQLQLNIGDTFLSSHGLVENSIDVHSDELTVVGILKPTQKVIDRLIITNLESIWEVHNHHDHNHNHHKEITSLLITFKSPRALMTFPNRINKSTNMQAALPKYELTKLYDYTSVGFKTISWIAYVILLISCLTIFMSFYKMVKERAYDLAILRTYGASNFQLIKMLILEALIVVSIAFTAGFLLVKLGLSTAMRAHPSMGPQHLLHALPLKDVLQLLALILTMVFISVVLAIYPLMKMNISKIISHEK